MWGALDRFLQGILKIADVNPLSAVALLFLVTVCVVVVCVMLLGKLWFNLKREQNLRIEKDAKQKKKEEGFVHTAGLLNIMEAKLHERFTKIEERLASRPECYFVGDSGESKRGALFDMKNDLNALRDDVKEVKQFVIFRPKNGGV